jgi:predicted phage tail protein
MKKWYQDKTGDFSSKRVIGAIVTGMALIMASILFGYSLEKGAKDPGTAMTVIKAMFTAGSALLVGGVIEVFGKKK